MAEAVRNPLNRTALTQAYYRVRVHLLLWMASATLMLADDAAMLALAFC